MPQVNADTHKKENQKVLCEDKITNKHITLSSYTAILNPFPLLSIIHSSKK